MPPFGPVSRRDLIHYLKRAGFDGPFSGAKHEFMIRGVTRVTIPNPHRGDIGNNLLSRLLRQIQISRDEWEQL
jgi:hypothetical protein